MLCVGRRTTRRRPSPVDGESHVDSSRGTFSTLPLADERLFQVACGRFKIREHMAERQPDRLTRLQNLASHRREDGLRPRGPDCLFRRLVGRCFGRLNAQRAGGRATSSARPFFLAALGVAGLVSPFLPRSTVGSVTGLAGGCSLQPTPMTGTTASDKMATRVTNSRTNLIRDALSIDSSELRGCRTAPAVRLFNSAAAGCATNLQPEPGGFVFVVGRYAEKRRKFSPVGQFPMPKRVLLAGLFHETHTFLDGATPLSEFSIRRGDELLEAAGDGSPLSGVLEVAASRGWDLRPVVDLRATPSATVEDGVFEFFWQQFAAAYAREQGAGLDGVFLVMHGAMACASVRDVEGELIDRIRAPAGGSRPASMWRPRSAWKFVAADDRANSGIDRLPHEPACRRAAGSR